MIPALALALAAPVAKKYSSPGGENEKAGLIVKTEKVWHGRQRGVEERRKISWKREEGKIFAVINGGERHGAQVQKVR